MSISITKCLSGKSVHGSVKGCCFLFLQIFWFDHDEWTINQLFVSPMQAFGLVSFRV